MSLLSELESMWDRSLGETTTVKHHLDLKPNFRLAFQNPYRAKSKKRKHDGHETDRMLKKDEIKPAISEWASLVVFAPKNDGKLHFCVDYRELNASTVRDTYPLLRMNECIDCAENAAIIPTLNCSSGYQQVEVPEADRDKNYFFQPPRTSPTYPGAV